VFLVKAESDRWEVCGVGYDDGGARAVLAPDNEPSVSEWTADMASRRAFEEPEKDVARLSVGVAPAYESEKADSYGLLGNGNDVVLSVDFRFDILR
jgi:hypothetical protein